MRLAADTISETPPSPTFCMCIIYVSPRERPPECCRYPGYGLLSSTHTATSGSSLPDDNRGRQAAQRRIRSQPPVSRSNNDLHRPHPVGWVVEPAQDHSLAFPRYLVQYVTFLSSTLTQRPGCACTQPTLL